jgi:peptidoglycan lytic transglycosylase
MRPGRRGFGRWLAVFGGLLLAACGSTQHERIAPGVGHYKLGNPYQIDGRWYYPAYDPSYAAVGVASWYGYPFHGRATANGELFDRDRPSAAHPTLPLPSIVRVTNLANQRQLELRVNDRGPFVGDRIIDLSQAAARDLGFENDGTTQVRVEFVRLADAQGVPPQPTTPVRVAARQTAAAAPAASEAAELPPEPAIRTVAWAAPSARVAPPASPAGDPLAKRCLGFIQVGAFIDAERAVRLAKELDAAMTLPVSTDLPSVDRYARVRLGPIGDAREAEAALRWLHQTGYASAFMVKPDVTSWVAC